EKAVLFKKGDEIMFPEIEEKKSKKYKKPVAIVYFCQACGQRRACRVDGELSECCKCSDEVKKCPDSKKYLYREDCSVKFNCCLSNP
ncbi:MAG: hypothetical protein V3574_03965, partial [Candidatus Moraniibacteriota bacterium]